MEPSELLGFRYILAGGMDRDRLPLFLLHKTGGDERELLPLADQVAPGAPVIAVRGTVVEDGKHRFFRRISPGVFDEDDLRDRATMLARFVDTITERYGLPRPVALGLSNGANIAAAVLQLWPGTFSGDVLLRPAPLFVTPAPPAGPGVPALIVAGVEDEIVKAADSMRLAAELSRFGAVVDYRAVQAGHGLVEADFDIVRTWLSTRCNSTAQALNP